MPSHVDRSTLRHVWHDLRGLNPWLESRKMGLNTGCKSANTAFCTTLSTVDATDKGLPPSGVGRITRCAGFGAYLCLRSSSDRFAKPLSVISVGALPSIPGVTVRWSLLYAALRFSTSYTSSYATDFWDFIFGSILSRVETSLWRLWILKIATIGEQPRLHVESFNCITIVIFCTCQIEVENWSDNKIAPCLLWTPTLSTLWILIRC